MIVMQTTAASVTEGPKDERTELEDLVIETLSLYLKIFYKEKDRYLRLFYVF